MKLRPRFFPPESTETPLRSGKRSRKKRILALGLAIGFVLLFLDLLWGYRAIGYKPVDGRYANEKYDYAFDIPNGWHLATSAMHSLNSGVRSWWEMLFYTYKTADFVLLTDWDFKNELLLTDGIDRLSLKGLWVPYAKLLSGSYILIDTSAGLDYETARKISTSSEGNKQMRIRDVREVDLGQGNIAARYVVTDSQSPDKEIETAYIPYSRNSPGFRNERIQGITIRTLRDEAFDERVFSQLLESFRYSN